jgi:hypothetical protein
VLGVGQPLAQGDLCIFRPGGRVSNLEELPFHLPHARDVLWLALPVPLEPPDDLPQLLRLPRGLRHGRLQLLNLPGPALQRGLIPRSLLAESLQLPPSILQVGLDQIRSAVRDRRLA